MLIIGWRCPDIRKVFYKKNCLAIIKCHLKISRDCENVCIMEYKMIATTQHDTDISLSYPRSCQCTAKYTRLCLVIQIAQSHPRSSQCPTKTWNRYHFLSVPGKIHETIYIVIQISHSPFMVLPVPNKIHETVGLFHTLKQ